MSAVHGEPVLWVNTRTELSAGPWADAGEQAWDRALDRALARYPNLKIFNWSAVAQPAWFLADGIHYNTPGCAIRAHDIAAALGRAFPPAAPAPPASSPNPSPPAVPSPPADPVAPGRPSAPGRRPGQSPQPPIAPAGAGPKHGPTGQNLRPAENRQTARPEWPGHDL